MTEPSLLDGLDTFGADLPDDRYLRTLDPWVSLAMAAAVTSTIRLATAVALLSFPDPWMSVVVGGTYLALTSLEGQLITPYFVGRVLQLNTVIVFLSIAFWAWLWSVVGMIIAVPILVVIRVFAEHIEALEPLGDFLTARGAESAPPEEDPKESRAAPTAAAICSRTARIGRSMPAMSTMVSRRVIASRGPLACTVDSEPS